MLKLYCDGCGERMARRFSDLGLTSYQSALGAPSAAADLCELCSFKVHKALRKILLPHAFGTSSPGETNSPVGTNSRPRD